jgi:small subunit ribosomal protein S4
MKRKHKSYSRPKRPFDKLRIDEEKEIKKEFGLKNKREIWKTDARIKSIREKAKKLISAGKDQQELLFNKLKKIGLEVSSIADVLGLDKKDYLERRLQTILVKKKLTTTAKSARQLITHKKVLVNGKVIDSPSYIVPVKLEDKISLKEKKKKEKPKIEEPAEAEEVKENIEEKQNE